MGSAVKTQVVKYLRKGIQGDKGDPGNDAVIVVVSPQNVVLKKGIKIITNIYVDFYKGEEQIPCNFDGTTSGGFNFSMLTYYGALPTGLDWSYSITDEGRFYYMLKYLGTADIDAEIPFWVSYNGIRYEQKIAVRTIADGDPGEKGDQGATLRGPQAWSDCATGYAFKAGGAGEQWKDVVLYEGNYYSCVKSHTKTANNYPNSPTATVNGYWQLGDRIELVATKILLATYALVENLGVTAIEMKDSDGNTLFEAKDGNVTCKTGTFDGITVRNAEIESGKIAGFNIKGNGLTNDPFANDAYVVFRNDTNNTFAGIGGNVTPTTAQMRAVARFANEDANDNWGIGRNIAMLLSAKNGHHNHAFIGSGNGNLDGWIGGYRYSNLNLTVANTIYDSSYIDISKNNVWVVCATVSGSGITLPSMTEVRNALGITSDSVRFCVQFTLVADLLSSNFFVYARNRLKDGSGATPWNTKEVPLLCHWAGGTNDYVEVSAGQSMTLLLIYDPSKSGKINDYTLTYTARRINHQS